mgnify:CR=1 FL=1
MSVVVVIDLIAKDSYLEPIIEQLCKILPDTKAYDGCLFLKMAVYEGKNVVALYEEWETKEHQEAYAAWRMANGHELIEPHIETFQASYADVLKSF